MSADPEHSIWLLRSEPTRERWLVELYQIVEGAREDAIFHFGSAGAFVRSLIFNSRDEAVANSHFREALRQLVDSWHPLDSPNVERDPRNLRILQLLVAYTPGEGMAQVLILLRHLSRYAQRHGDFQAQQLKSLALQTMERYFPLEQGPAGAFAEYVEQLEVNLASPDYALYAAKRLRELRKLRAGAEISRLIERDVELLPKLISIFAPPDTPHTEDLARLAELYTCCLNAANARDALTLYRAAIRSRGLRLVEGAQPRLEVSAAKRKGVPRGRSRYDLYVARVKDVCKFAAKDRERIKREARAERPAVPAKLLPFSKATRSRSPEAT